MISSKHLSHKYLQLPGNPVEIKGSVSVIIELGGVRSITKLIVADVDIDAILGLDFLKATTVR